MSSPTPQITCTASDTFGDWISRADGAVAVSTYQAGKVALIGFDGQRITTLLRHFDKPMGLAADGTRLAVATRNDIVLLADAPTLAPEFPPGRPGGYDRLYLPRASYRTCDLQVHDLAFSGDDVWIVNTRFSCLATLSSTFSFEPRWQPPFISELVPEDRCHLNGLAMQPGRPTFVTALGATDTPGGWRPGKIDGGVLIDVYSGEIVASGLCMPHSPRWHDGRLWLLNSGQGELCVVDPADGRMTVACRLPGYLRGLCFAGSYALVGLSRIRESHTFGGLPIGEQYDTLRCGLMVVDLERGEPAGLLEFAAGCEELYDLQFLPGARQPMILNLDDDLSRQAIPAPGFGYWMLPRGSQ